MDNLINILSDFDIIDSNDKEADASISLNPNVSWAKFIFTDDKPNVNKQRIPKEEFPNIIKTGVHMPIKMATGKINDGHEESVPLGVITNLKEDNNKVIGLAALWLTERENDVSMLRQMKKEGKSPQLSWEVLYSDSSIKDDVEDLHGVVVKANTIVGLPAYAGRTPILALSSEVINVEELEQLKAKIVELEKENAQLKTVMTEKDSALAGKDTELTVLKEFKAAIEKKEAELTKLAAIKDKFEKAQIAKDDTYYNEKKDLLLSLDDAAIDFMIQEMVAFSTAKTSESSVKNPKVPKIINAERTITDPKELASALKDFMNKGK